MQYVLQKANENFIPKQKERRGTHKKKETEIEMVGGGTTEKLNF